MMMMYNTTTRILVLLISLLLVITNVVAVVSSFQSDSDSTFESQHYQEQHQGQYQSDQSDQEHQEEEDNVVEKKNRNLQGTIKDKWAIADPPTWNYNDLDFFIEFQVSNYIIPGQAHVEIYSYDTCKDDGPSGLPGSGTIQTNGFKPLQPENIDYSDWNDNEESILYTDINFDVTGKKIIIPISIDSTTIGSNSDVYQTYEDSNSNTQGKMKFCVRYSLRTLNPNDPIEMNFREVLVTLDIILSPNSFELGGAAVVVQKADTGIFMPDLYDGVIFELVGYICNPITGIELTGTIINTQGELIDICVKPATKDRNEGIIMYNIKEFTWIRNDSGTVRTQKAIENGISSSNGLSKYIPENCPYSNYCTFNTFLSSSFYFDGQGVVGGSGIASMTYEGTGTNPTANNGNGRRNRRNRRTTTTMDVNFNIINNNSKRSLQDNNNNEDEDDNALFELKINVAAMDDNTNGQKAAAAAPAAISAMSMWSTTAIIIAATTSAAAFIITM